MISDALVSILNLSTYTDVKDYLIIQEIKDTKELSVGDYVLLSGFSNKLRKVTIYKGKKPRVLGGKAIPDDALFLDTVVAFETNWMWISNGKIEVTNTSYQFDHVYKLYKLN